MWALALARIAELTLAIAAAVKSVSTAFAQWQAIMLGRAAGQADNEAARAAAAEKAAGQMRAIADELSEPDEVIRRLEEGSA